MPALHVYRSNRTEALAAALASVLRAHPPPPFEPVEIVVGRSGMERWLRHRLAEQLGVCANVEFPFPAGRIDRIVSKVLGEEVERDQRPPDPWAPEGLTWALLEVLPGLVAEPGFEEVLGYVEDWAAPVDGKQYGLAVQLANLFDRYVAYRPELARAWSAGEGAGLPGGSEGLVWQHRLWRAVCDKLGEKQHRAERIHRAQLALERGEAAEGLDSPLRIFGVSSLPPSWMRLLGALSKVTDVDLFLLCPSDQYWADLQRKVRGTEVAWLTCDRDGEEIRGLGSEKGNPLLVSMGRLARDFQVVLESQPDDYEDQRLELFSDPGVGESPCALHCIQSDLLAARHPSDAPDREQRKLLPSDDSVQFHGCYGPTRQVEVLRDLLLGLLEDHPDLEPRDILVLTPDIEKYAPLITAVFSQGPSFRMRGDDGVNTGPEGWGLMGAPRIPFHVADLSVRRLNPVADALLRILEMADGRLAASSVVDLITLEPVRTRFGITAEELPTIEQWVTESGIRWGRDAAHRSQENQPEDLQNTWRFGLQRLLLGVVMADDDKLVAGAEGVVRPFDAMEGGQTLLLGRFVDFVNTVFAVLDRLREPRPLGKWIEMLSVVLDQCTEPPEGATWLERRVRESLEGIGKNGEAAGTQREVTLAAIRATLGGRFEEPSPVTREQSGGVTFCALQPMRSVPYAVVCLLGMDEGVFPRKTEGLAFDLIRRHSRIGDRNPRDEDRFLVLEALLAARRHLVVLHTGRDARTNEARPPCVPVGELRDLVDQTFPEPGPGLLPSEFLTTHHPLQAFSPKAFSPFYRNPRNPDSARPWSFDRRLMAGAEAWRDKLDTRPPFFSEIESVTPAADAQEEIPIERLIQFFKNPIEFLVKTRLGINLRDEAKEISDREPIELGALESWQLRHALLRERVRQPELGRPPVDPEERDAALLRKMRAGGTLPLGYAGDVIVEHEAELVDTMLAKSLVLPAGAREPVKPNDPVKLDVTLGNVRVTGQLSRVYGDFLVDFQFAAKERPKYLAELWIPLLAWHATPESIRQQSPGRGVLVLGSWNKGKTDVKLFGYEAPEDAGRMLAELVSLYLRGIHEPIPLFPLSSWEFAWRIRDHVRDPTFFDEGKPDDPKLIHALRDAHDAALKVWADNSWGADLDDDHIARVFEGQTPLVDPNETPVPIDREFARLALTLWGPVCAKRQTTATVAYKWLAGGFS